MFPRNKNLNKWLLPYEQTQDEHTVQTVWFLSFIMLTTFRQQNFDMILRTTVDIRKTDIHAYELLTVLRLWVLPC